MNQPRMAGSLSEFLLPTLFFTITNCPFGGKPKMKLFQDFVQTNVFLNENLVKYWSTIVM